MVGAVPPNPSPFRPSGNILQNFAEYRDGNAFQSLVIAILFGNFARFSLGKPEGI